MGNRPESSMRARSRGYPARHVRPRRKRHLGIVMIPVLIGFIAALGVTALGGTANAAPAPLPAYPGTITLNLGDAACITHDVIMNDPLDSTSPITDTASQPPGNGAAGVHSTDITGPVTYYLWYLNDNTNTWQFDPPPGTRINTTTGVISSYDGMNPGVYPAGTSTGGFIYGGHPDPGSVSYIVRDHGRDTGSGAVGTTQFELQVNTDNPFVSGDPTSVVYEGNDFNNANGALTIQLNAGSTDSTALTLSAIASSLNIPDVGNVGSTPVTFTLVAPAGGWKLNGGNRTDVYHCRIRSGDRGDHRRSRRGVLHPQRDLHHVRRGLLHQ